MEKLDGLTTAKDLVIKDLLGRTWVLTWDFSINTKNNKKFIIFI